jgi:hypothetical protein
VAFWTNERDLHHASLTGCCAMQAQPDMIFTLLSTLFNQLLFGAVNHWAITRPILSLMLASEEVRGAAYTMSRLPHHPNQKTRSSNIAPAMHAAGLQCI